MGMICTPSEYLDYASTIYNRFIPQPRNGNQHERKEYYYYLPGAFDTEFTSMYLNVAGEPLKVGIMYAWMYGMGEPDSPVCIGRTWDEYVEFVYQLQRLLTLGEGYRQLVYVHNLSAEFQYMHPWFTWDKVFLMESHRPVYAISKGLEYRCSLKLSGGRSLKAIGDNLVDQRFRKLTGDLDYQLLRTPITPLTPKEQGYCENDIRVLLAYIKEKVEQDGNLWNIPLTNTGYVRRHIKEKCFKKSSYKQRIKKLTLTPDSYTMCHDAFRGGDTHANAAFVEVRLADGEFARNPNLNRDGSVDNVHSQDLTSSYPAVMVLEKFPMSTPHFHPEVKTVGELTETIKNKRALFTLKMWNVTPLKDFHHLIPVSKCKKVINALEDNGRIVEAEYIEFPLTDVELPFILRFYAAGQIEIGDVITWDAAYLPTPIVKALLELYSNKTSLKGVPGQERNYMISKNMANASFGMMVTNIIRDLFEYDNEEGFLPKKHPILEEEIERYNKNHNRFLYYPWGIFITAFARTNLWKAIEELGWDFIYCDTDSVKYLNAEKHSDFFARYNEECREKARRSSQYHRIPMEQFAPKSKTGESFPIGLWDYEGWYTKFKTLGAKRYLVQVSEEKYRKLLKDYPHLKGPYLLTCAGLNKELGTNFLINSGDPFRTFSLDMKVPKEQSGRLVHSYLDYEVTGKVRDYLGNVAEVHEKSMLHLEPSPYEMHSMQKYVDYLRKRALGNDTVI